MSPYIENAFNVLSFAPGPFWLVLLVCPQNRYGMAAFDLFLILLSAHFTFLTVPAVPALLPVIAAPTFETVGAFLSTPSGILGSWNHMILADLWIGRWIVFDGVRHQLHRVLISVFVLVTLFFGPLGFFLFWLTRVALRREWRLFYIGG